MEVLIRESIGLSPDKLGTHEGREMQDFFIKDLRERVSEDGIELGRIEITTDNGGHCCTLTATVLGPVRITRADAPVKSKTKKGDSDNGN